MKGSRANDPRGSEDKVGDIPHEPDNMPDDGYRDEPRDEHTSTMHLPDEGDGAEGDWIVCDVCEGAWRPDAPEDHEADCEAMLLHREQARCQELRRMLISSRPRTENDELVLIRERVQDLENVLGMIPRDHLADGIQRAMKNVLGDPPVLIQEKLRKTQEALEKLCDDIVAAAARTGRQAVDHQGDHKRLAKRLSEVSGDLTDSVRTARKATI